MLVSGVSVSYSLPSARDRFYPEKPKRLNPRLRADSPACVAPLNSSCSVSSPVTTPDNFTIFEGTSEIQRMIIGRTVTGLDARKPDLRFYRGTGGEAGRPALKWVGRFSCPV